MLTTFDDFLRYVILSLRYVSLILCYLTLSFYVK